MNNLIFKEDIQQIFKSYKSDITIDEAIRIVESHGKLNESKSISVDNAFGTIVMKLYESIELNEALDPELEQIATQWAPMIKKLVDSGKDPVAKIKGAIEHLTKEGDITKEEVGPFITSLVSKTQVSDDIKKQLTSIGSATPEPKMPTSLPGVIAEVKKQVTTTKTPEEAEKKANDGIKKAGLKGKLLEYETGIYKWIGKLPLVGGWFSKRSKTQQRIIVLIAIAILSYLVYQGVKWAIKVMDEATKRDNHLKVNQDRVRDTVARKAREIASDHAEETEVMKKSAINKFIQSHGGGGKAMGLVNGATKVIAKDGSEMLTIPDASGNGITIIDKATDPQQYEELTKGVKTMADLVAGK